MLFNDAVTELKTKFVEREDIIEALFVALIGELHLLLLGPPGTAKSALLNSVGQMSGLTVFRHLLTKFTTPEELFGPISLKSLERDDFLRITVGKLPEAHLAFLDEVFKANSAILNALLTLMEERYFDNGSRSGKTPLITLVGASNEQPEDKTTAALFDRFHFRFWVNYVDDSNIATVLKSDINLTERIDVNALVTAQCECIDVDLPDKIVEKLINVRRELRLAGFVVSDRRMKQIATRAMPASAMLHERDQVDDDDARLLPNLLAEESADVSKIKRVVMNSFDCRALEAADRFDAFVEAIEQFYEQASTTNGGRAQTLDAAAKLIEHGRQEYRQLKRLDTRKAEALNTRLDGVRRQIAKMANLDFGTSDAPPAS